jgi:hypothetical protein
MTVHGTRLVVLQFWALTAFGNAIDVNLGTASSFAVLAGSTVTNTGPSMIDGNVGVSPGTAITGFPPGTVVPPYTIHAGDAVAAQAQSDLTTAYNFAAGEAPDLNLTGQNLGGLILTPGVYFFSSSAQLTGTLTLNAQGNPNAVFLFQIGSTFTTASNSSVVMINGGQDSDVFWQVGSSATLGTNTALIGSILALTSISLNTGADILDGQALARNGAVTLDANDVSISSTPEPSTGTLLGTGLLLGMIAYAWSRTVDRTTGWCWSVELRDHGVHLDEEQYLTPTKTAHHQLKIMPTDLLSVS